MRLIPKIGLSGPAAIDHDGICDKVYINPLYWLILSGDEKDFILAHEKAHCEYDIYDEIAADEVGLAEFLEEGGEVKDALSAMEKTLNSRSPSHRQRIQNMRNLLFNRSYFRPRRRSYFGPLDEDLEPEESGWSPEDWNNFFNTLGNAGPDWIRALMGHPDPNMMPPLPPEEEGLSPTTLLIIVGGIVAVVAIAIALKK